MIVIDQIAILDDKIKSNQAQYDLGREAAKISALSSEDLLEKYEYLTGEDLQQRPGTLKKRLSILHWVRLWLITLKRKQKENKDKYLVYNLQYNFTKFKNIDEFKELSFGSIYKKLNDFKRKKFNKLKIVVPQVEENKDLQPKVLDNAGDLVHLQGYIQ